MRLAAVVATALVVNASAAPPPDAGLDIQPMTTIGPDGAGYLADPQPIRLAPSAGERVQMLSGTTRAVIRCAYPLRPGCFEWSRLSIDAGSLAAPIAAAGATITNFQNIDLFQDDAGGWHAAVTIGIHTPAHPDHWTVTAHAHPVGDTSPDAAPLAWSADTVLSGSLTDPAAGNYDAKYYEDDGRLWLLYVRNTAPRPDLRNEVVIQAMRSPTELAPEPPVALLSPGDRFGPLASEVYATTRARLVEAPWIVRIGDKYALIYSTGAYETAGYKAAVAWSDTLLPAQGAHYRKVLEADPAGIWGVPGGHDVHYLVQSARPRWPNFTGGRVVGPGVAAAVRGPRGGWWLFFNGFAPDDMPRRPDGRVDANHRRPFALPLKAAVPEGRRVVDATDAELATWLVPQAR